METSASPTISYISIARLSFPIILANMAVPLLGLVDTAVIGHNGTASDLGAIALGSLIFTFVFWAFGFLRMSTTGFIAQAIEANDINEARAALNRAILLGVVIGSSLFALQYPIIRTALWLLGGSEIVETQVEAYWDIRIWAAPATLTTYAVMGALIGLGKTRQLLWLQLALNGTNLVLDVVFVIGLGWGVKGIAAGTLIAEWAAALLGLWLVTPYLRVPGQPYWHWHIIANRSAFRRTLSTNTDILWRTLFMLAGFAFFANQGAKFGDTALAANHILLQFISFSAFFLDGFAFATESLVGRAIGIRNQGLFDRVIRVSSHLAAATAVSLAMLLLLLGSSIIERLTSIADVQAYATAYLPYAALYVGVSFAAFQLDGVFIGATRSRAMRNASLIALLIFLMAYTLTRYLDNHGLWIAFVIYVIARALALGYYYPQLRRDLRA